MKQQYIFLLIVACLLAISLGAFAQQLPSDSAYTKTAPSPYYLKAQFAGGIGFVSLGVGRYFVQDKLETDLFIGYLPESIGGDRIVTSAIKATYIAVKPLQVKSIEWQPLRTGLQLSYTFGDEYYVTGPEDKYPRSYYGFSTALLLHLHVGGQLSMDTPQKLKKFALYYELGSNSKYIASYAQSPKYLSPFKIFNLALGLRMKL
jgi:hypothetical protein